MIKITFIGAGSTVFAKNVLGDCIVTPSIGEMDIALYDINAQRLEESYEMLVNINRKYAGKAKISKYTDRKLALKLNHPTREMNWFTAYKLVETMFEA